MNRKQRRAEQKQGALATQRAPVGVPALLAAALDHHGAGRLGEAERLYRQVLAADPRHADSLHLLGVMGSQRGHPDTAVEMIGQAIAIDAGVAAYHANLANALTEQGRYDAAVACYRTALDLRPGYPEAHSNLGVALTELGRLDEAAACHRRAIALRPDYPEAHNNLGSALQKLARPDEAIASYRRAIALRPGYPEAHSNLGLALAHQGRLDEAIACHRRALDLRAAYPEAHNNLGNALTEQGRLEEAVACHRRAIALRPDYPEAHFNLALAMLTMGDLAAGWVEHEWRWKTPEMRRHHRTFPQPQWRGEAAAGQTLLIHAEQGFGDTLQFCRYAAMAAARGLRVITEVPKPLVRLLHSLAGIDRVVERGEALPDFDLHCPMLSLPLAFATTLASIPGAVPYLHAEPALVAAWRTRLAALDRARRIGLAWAGSSTMVADRRRSLAPERLAPLFDVPGVHFFGLQKDGPAAPAHVPLTDFMAEMNDFADTASLIANLDLVISVDTAVAHLAAAMGKPVWLLDRFAPDWRWLLGRRDSPWYPTLRIYRQPRPGDWDAVIAEIVRDLRDLGVPG